MNFEQWKVSTRLGLGFGLAVFIGVLIAIIGTVQLRFLSGLIDGLATDRMVKVSKANELSDNLNDGARAVRNLLLVSDPAAKAAELQALKQAAQANDKLVAELDAMLVLPRGRELLANYKTRTAAYQAALDKVVAAAAAGESERAVALLLGEVKDGRKALFQASEEMLAFQTQLALADAARGAQTASLTGAVLLAGSVLLAVVGGLVGWGLTRSLQRSLGAEPADLSRALARVADGDLAFGMAVRAGDTSSTLATAARMQQALVDLVGSVRANAEHVATASAQIAQGNQDLSSRTEEQASALQQTAASMEQLGAAVRQNADSAQQADQLAKGANDVALKGGAVVDEVVSTVKGINEASRRIADIIGTIDGIAFQTNILALNAAVEAARAGEQGRGFAVVASEVRSLAQRSADAAKEIKTLIGTSVERTERGAALADAAGATMQEVVGAIRRVAQVIGEISAASAEQSSGVTQVGEAVSQMDQATQQNAALVEESAAAAESLKDQAGRLVNAVSVFQLNQARA